MKSARKRTDRNQEDTNEDENGEERTQSSVSLPTVTKTRNEKEKTEKNEVASKAKSHTPVPFRAHNRRKATWNETTNLIAFPPPPMHLPPRPKNVTKTNTHANVNTNNINTNVNKNVKSVAVEKGSGSQPNNSVAQINVAYPTPTSKKSGHLSNFRKKIQNQNPRTSQVSSIPKNSQNSMSSTRSKLKYYHRSNIAPNSSKHKNFVQNIGNSNSDRNQNRNSTSLKNSTSSKNSTIFQSNRSLQNRGYSKKYDTSGKPSRSFSRSTSRSPSPSSKSKSKPKKTPAPAQQKPHTAPIPATKVESTTAKGKQGNLDTKNLETTSQKKKISSKPIISAVSLVFKNQNPRSVGAPSMIAYPSKSLTVQNVESKPKVKPNNNSNHNTNNNNNKKPVQSRSLVPSVQLGNTRDLKESDEIRKTEKAIKEGHIFEIRGWNVNSAVRETFLQRGWVEKIRVPKRNQQQAPPTSFQSKKSEDNSDPFKFDGESNQSRSVTKRMLNIRPPNFIWADWTHKICWPLAFDFQYINRHPQDGFTLKKNLIEPMQKLHWIGTEFGTSVRAFPRCYRLFVNEEKRAFLHDYRLTSCLSLLKWFVHSVDQTQEQDGGGGGPKEGSASVVSVISLDNDTDPRSHLSLLHCVDFALQQIQQYIRVRRHQDIDEVNEDEEKFDEGTKANSLIQMQIQKPDDQEDEDKVGKEKEETEEDAFKKNEEELDKNLVMEKSEDDKDKNIEMNIDGISNTVQNQNPNDAKSGTSITKSIESVSDDNTKPIMGQLNWETFLNHVYELTHQSTKFEVKVTSKEGAIEEGVKYMEAKRTLEDFKPFWNQYHIDGMRNVWIFKPGDGTQGQDIVVMDKYEDISRLFFNADTSGTLWMAQKYIERPLLIFDTKFDIRQWFLVSSWNPLIVWMYKKCYLRFSTQLFNLDNLSNSIHLTNKHVQQKYRSHIDPARDHSIPNDSMWHSATFQTYLKTIGKPNIWSKVIYPGMKKAILGILLATRESIVHRPGSFHVHGADFMLSDDFKPWLIEINSNLVYNNSTSITAQLCPQCIRDTLKVILDWRGGANPDVDTGDFELLYRATTKLPSSHDLTTNDLPISSSKEYLIQGQSLPVSDDLPEPSPSYVSHPPLDKFQNSDKNKEKNKEINDYGQENEEESEVNG